MKKRPAVKIDHDYLSINFGNGRVFTLGRSGEKGTNLPEDVFVRLSKFVRDKAHRDYEVAINAAADQADVLFPGWDEAPVTFEIGQEVVGPGGRRGVVKGKKRTNVVVQFETDKFETLLSPFLLKSN